MQRCVAVVVGEVEARHDGGSPCQMWQRELNRTARAVGWLGGVVEAQKMEVDGVRAAWEGVGRGKLQREVGRLARARQRELMGLPRWMTRLKAAFQLPSKRPNPRSTAATPVTTAGSGWPKLGGSSGETGRDSFLAGSVAIFNSQLTSCNHTTATSLCLLLPCLFFPPTAYRFCICSLLLLQRLL